MGLKSKIKGSYAYTQWKLGKYTKRRVKNSISPDWVMERQQYERDRIENYSNNFYHNREIDTTYRMPPVRNNEYNEPKEDTVNARSVPRPVSTSVIPMGTNRRDRNGNPIRYSSVIDTDQYNRVTLQRSDFSDVLVPSRNYTLVQKSNSSSVAYYSNDNALNNERYAQRSYSYTTNDFPPRNIDRRNI
ncbi:hypothetical protein H8356DRAFT_1269264 [Neocallimastix lanati (nom. inval.)]|jgi:hypothetical protein|uniref:Uncharacterized protein n=1 Tax=Neocallimastix californiae TaxID=1754190 RepID=A0A1Y2CHB2_9FUNG|nr:hypothetical protein H8356DRAFT_1269264 [Neocallimastix sp. JGI-2020a]ORY46297.1 hypothetical protein LY90DRAFT_509305 [Neocallimastix californiae]|eukprot:ORY46297.1 hypothetical protein LY90DRAFT_509305 [Neocallimastix californiae]